MRLLDVILWRIAEAPVAIADLVRWVRVQWPRILPDAVGRIVCVLMRQDFVECREGKWQIKRDRKAGPEGEDEL